MQAEIGYMSFGLRFDARGWKVLVWIVAAIPLLLFVSFLMPLYVTFLFINFLLLYLMVLFLLLFLKQPSEIQPKPLRKPLTLAVLVACYNSKATIEKCVQTIRSLQYSLPFRIIVVDDGSTDGSKEILRGLRGIEVIEFEKNKGKGFALNRGLEEIRNEDLIVCVDSDTYLEPAALEKAVGFFEDQNVGAVNGMLIPDKRSSFLQKLQYFEYMISFGLWGTVLSSINGMSYVTGPFTVFRKSALQKAGYFFDTHNLAEDMEIGLRLQQFHYTIKVCPAIVNETDVPDSLSKLIKQRDRWYRSRVFNLIKYRNLFFRSEYGSLGLFALPYLFFVELIMLVMLLRIILLGANQLVQSLQLGNLLFFSAKMWPQWSWSFIVPTQAYFLAASLLVVGVFYWKALELARYRFDWRDSPVILVHLLLYPLFISSVYLRGVWREWRGAKAVWERSSVQ